jgi:hypothetical protein
MSWFLPTTILAKRSDSHTSKQRQNLRTVSPYHRRLLFEALETRTLLSVSLAGVPTGGPAWGQTAEITEPNFAKGDNFGQSVSISGNTMVVGALVANSDKGAAYVFTWSGSAWTPTAELTASDGAAGAEFGVSVSIDGNTIVVGALGAKINGQREPGAAYVFTGSGSAWTQAAELTASDGVANDLFGYSVSISGNTVVSGAPGGLGAAYVFAKPAGGWANMTQSAELTQPGIVSNDLFGREVAISGNTVVVGADYATPGSSSAAGAAYVFTGSGSVWTQTAVLTASNGATNDHLGSAVSISSDANTVVVGANMGGKPGPGAAYVFVKPNSGWANMTQTAELTASGGVAGDVFGSSVSISGNTVVVGANGLKSAQGAAYVYAKPAGGWKNMTQTTKLTASDAAAGADFGGDMAVSISGNTLVAGAPLAKGNGAAYVFTGSGSAWSQTAEITEPNFAKGDNFGQSVSISGNTMVVGALFANGDKGAAYVFTWSGSAWTPTAELTASDGAAGAEFGVSVSIDGNTIVVGALGATIDGQSDQGAAYVFTKSGSSWTQAAELTASDGVANDLFGYSVSISGNTVVSGAPGNVGADNIGAAYMFAKPVSGWKNMTQSAKVTQPGIVSNTLFGREVAISGNTVVVGADYATPGSNSAAGAAYVFTKSGSAWNQTAVLTASDGATDDHFGSAISINSNANTVVVGASMMGNRGPGSAYVFTRSGSSWTQAAELTASDGVADDLFGNSVSISGNNVVVGAYGVLSNQGAAYVYAKPAGGWTNMTQTTKLTASDAKAGADFGDDMAVSISGNTLVAGAPLANGNGAAYVFGPAILTVSTSAAAGAHFKAGGKVPITVTFSAPVKVSGTPQLTLADGGTAKFSRGSGTTTLTFTYTVAAGQNTTDLDYASTAALLLNGGSIKDLKGNAVNLTLPPTGTDGLATKEIVVDTTPPTVTAVSSTMAAGTYGAGTAIPITVTFSEVVNVTGKPKLALDAGSGAAAIYTGGSGTSTLTFTYTVAAKQNTADLDYSSITALTLNGGSIKDLAGNTAILTLLPTGTDGLAAEMIVINT